MRRVRQEKTHMLLDSQEKKLQSFVTPKKESVVSPQVLNANHIKVGTTKVMSHQDRLNWLRTSELGKLFGFKNDQSDRLN